MTKQELERYLEVESILKLHKVVINKDGLMSCPFHANCEGSLKLYRELNGVACMRESCSNYRKVFAAFEVLQKLKDCKADEAKLYGKSLLLQELEQLRAKKTPNTVVGIIGTRSLSKREEGLVDYLNNLKEFILEKGGSQDYEFRLSEVRKELNVHKSTQQRYVHELLEKGYLKQSSGSVNKGYYYQIVNWTGH